MKAVSRAHSARPILVVATVVLATLIGLTAFASTSTSPAKTKWPENESGQTYGSGLFARSLEDEPDLIQVAATNGRVGYSLREDLEDPDPESPAEAARISTARAGTSRAIPVYLSDGKTRIGVFVVEYGAGTVLH